MSSSFIFFLSSPSRQFNQVCRLTPNPVPVTGPLSFPLRSDLRISMPGTLWRDLGSRAQILLYLSSPLFSASLFADKVSLPALKKRKRSQKLLFLKSNVLVLELHHIKEKEKQTNQKKICTQWGCPTKFFSCRQNTKELLKEMSYVREGLSLCIRHQKDVNFVFFSLFFFGFCFASL